MRNRFGVFVALFLSTAVVYAQDQKRPLFSSVYTDVDKDCKADVQPDDSGSDLPLHCPVVGDFRISISFSAESASFMIEPVEGSDGGTPNVFAEGLDLLKRKIEWRLADGKPFALIYRQKGSLWLAGLPGYESMNDDVKTKQFPNANAEAHKRADAAYQKINK